MSKTYHNKRRSRAISSKLGAVHHEHGPDDICQYCGKARKGGLRKRERAALLDGLGQALNGNRPHQYLDLMATWDAVDWAYSYEPCTPDFTPTGEPT